MKMEIKNIGKKLVKENFIINNNLNFKIFQKIKILNKNNGTNYKIFQIIFLKFKLIKQYFIKKKNNNI